MFIIRTSAGSGVHKVWLWQERLCQLLVSNTEDTNIMSLIFVAHKWFILSIGSKVCDIILSFLVPN